MRAPDTVDARQALAPLTAPLFSLGRSDHHRQIPRGWWLLLAFSLAIAAYALAHILLGERMSPPNLADSFRARPWGIYTHAAAALFALAIGPLQFHGGPRARRLRLHRFLGRVYVAVSPATGLSGIYMAAYSYGGLVTHLGFGLIFAAVTLRLLLPLLVIAHGGAFEPAYRWVSWLCWVPNLLWAEWLVRRARLRTPSARLRPT